MAYLLEPLWNLHNVWAVLRLRFGNFVTGPSKFELDRMSPSMQQCYDLLHKTGRAFFVMISFLDNDLRDAVTVWYLITRAIDTFEDDMSLPNDVKVSNLSSFDKYLLDPTWKFTGSKDEYATVLEKFPVISQAFRELPNKYKEVISELGPQFAQNLIPFLGREIVTMKDFHDYSCHAGRFVCIAILRLFVASGLEDETVVEDTKTINEFSLFLHKTNFIKDFWKDWNSGKLGWPREIWSKYTNSPGDFLKKNNEMAVECLNEMIVNTLEHLPRCIHYMYKLKNPGTRRVYAINKVFGIASLELCYNNPEVFTKSVKIPRSEAAKIIHYSSSPSNIICMIRHYTLKIMKRASQKKSDATKIREVCLQILNHEEMQKYDTIYESTVSTIASAVIVLIVSAIFWLIYSAIA